MKIKLIFGFIFLSSIVNLAFACDLHNSSTGVNPFMNNNFISLEYKHSRFLGEHYHLESGTNLDNHAHEHNQMAARELLEYYSSYQLSASYYLVKKLQLSLGVPFVVNSEYADNELYETISGIGDIMTAIRYRIDKEKGATKFSYLLGSGMFFPTGKYTTQNTSGGINPLTQAGRGSLRLLVNGSAAITHKSVGVFSDASYTINAENDILYRFANRVNVSLSAYYKYKKNSFSFVPSIGSYSEFAGNDSYQDITMSNTGGNVTFLSVSSDVYYKDIFLSFSYKVPVYENLYGNQGENLSRITTSINYKI